MPLHVSLKKPLIWFATLCGLLPIMAGAHPIDDAQRTEIESIIHQYLIENPELLEEMISALRIREAAAAQAEAKKVIEDKHNQIFYPGSAFVAGNPKGDVTLVEFFDYTCSYCKESLKDVRRLMEQDNNLRVVFIDYPALSNRNPVSMVATRASVAAANQGKYVPFHLKMMGSMMPLTQKSILRYAKEVGLDEQQLLQDMNAPETYARIDDNIALAHALGMDGTPSFVIDDNVIAGALGYDTLRQIIALMRSRR